MMDDRPIAVFDSGLGSLSVIQLLQKEMPDESIVYLADREHYPYGRKTEEQMKSIILQTLKFLDKFDPKLIVVASITPSLQVLKECRLQTNVPVFGVYLNIGDAVSVSRTKFIALLATQSIVNSEVLDDYIKPYIMTTKILRINASPIIDLVEKGKFVQDVKEVREVIRDITAGINKNPKTDVTIFGSTHLPLLKEHFSSVYPNMEFIDPCVNTVNQVKTYIQNHDIASSKGGSMQILVSKEREQFEKIARSIGVEGKIVDVKLDFKMELV